MRAGVSLFSGGGIGDVGFRAAGLRFVAMCELEHDRAQLAAVNFPEAKVYGDIYEEADELVEHVARETGKVGEEIFLLSCTAPCQGMSKNGRGKLLREVREGRRPKADARNRLILPGIEIIKRVRPRFAVFENVCEMRQTIIEDWKGDYRPILMIIEDALSPEYVGMAYDVEFADYGVPQRRKRLITVYTRDEQAKPEFRRGVQLIPRVTHSREGGRGLERWVKAGEVLKRFPALDGRSAGSASDRSVALHRVPVLDRKKYEWIMHTPPGASSFDNQCVNPECGYQGNRTHGARRNREGINQANRDTPLYCERCGAMLPRPHVKLPDGTRRIMRGYTSAYKRMDPELPCPALTRNMSFPCSDNKLHPYENRVLSLAEAFAIHTIDAYDYRWGPLLDVRGRVREKAWDGLIRVVVGESIPPRFTHMLGEHLVRLAEGDERSGAAQIGRGGEMVLPLWGK